MAKKENNAQNEGISLVINAQYSKDLSFENPGAPLSLTNQTEMPDVNINFDVSATTLAEKTYEVSLRVKAEAKVEDKPVFITELVYAGVFTIECNEDVLEPLLFIECPRLLFPFARNIVADVVRDGGFPPLMINPFDFASMYQANRETAAAENAEKTVQ